MNNSDLIDYKKYPDRNLVDLFQQFENDNDIKEDFDRTRISINMMYQHRVYITPTLNIYDKGTLEETNRVIRQFHSYLSRFIRLSFVNEKREKGFYFLE